MAFRLYFLVPNKVLSITIQTLDLQQYIGETD